MQRSRVDLGWRALEWSGRRGRHRVGDRAHDPGHGGGVAFKKPGPWGSGGSDYLPPANAGVLPTPAHCSEAWPANASGIQCGGLRAMSSGSGSATECAKACCDDPHCSVWQWSAASKSPAGSGCWAGRQPISKIKCNKDAAWVDGSRAPPQPLPAPMHCDKPSQFPSNMSKVHCAGLLVLGADASVKTAGDCAIACCNDRSCAVWQFKEAVAAGGGCWRGTCQQPPNDAKG